MPCLVCHFASPRGESYRTSGRQTGAVGQRLYLATADVSRLGCAPTPGFARKDVASVFFSRLCQSSFFLPRYRNAWHVHRFGCHRCTVAAVGMPWVASSMAFSGSALSSSSYSGSRTSATLFMRRKLDCLERTSTFPPR